MIMKRFSIVELKNLFCPTNQIQSVIGKVVVMEAAAHVFETV